MRHHTEGWFPSGFRFVTTGLRGHPLGDPVGFLVVSVAKPIGDPAFYLAAVERDLHPHVSLDQLLGPLPCLDDPGGSPGIKKVTPDLGLHVPGPDPAVVVPHRDLHPRRLPVPEESPGDAVHLDVKDAPHPPDNTPVCGFLGENAPLPESADIRQRLLERRIEERGRYLVRGRFEGMRQGELHGGEDIPALVGYSGPSPYVLVNVTPDRE